MKATKVSQYSVFLINEPGSLQKLTAKLKEHGINISALSSDVKYEAAILKFIVDEKEGVDLSKVMTTAGYTNVRTDAISVDVPNEMGVMQEISTALAERKVNIINIYGSCVNNNSKLVIVVDDLESALQALNNCDVRNN